MSADTEIRRAKAEALRDVADYLGASGILWHGDSGVTVRELGWEKRWPVPGKPITEWLNDRADDIEEAGT